MALKIQVGAEVSSAISGLQSVSSTLDVTAKSTQDFAKIAEASTSKASAALEQIAPAALKAGDSLEQAFSGLSSLDFSNQFKTLQSQISESIDRMVGDATRGGAAFSNLAKQVTAFGGGVAAFSNNFKGIENASVSAIKSLDQLENEIYQLQAALNSSTDVGKIKALGQEIARLRTQANNLKVVGLETTLSKIGVAAGQAGSKMNITAKSSNQANGALLGVSRVIQDLPFGFQGIANNLTELPQLFRQVSVAAKDTGKSVGSVLLQSLKGAGGFGLAFSAVTTAITLASIGLGAWTRGLGASSAATKKAKDETEAYNTTLKNSFKETSEELAKVSTLVELFGRENISRKEKVNIIKELQSIAPGYFAQLDEENTTISKLTQAYDRYLSSLSKSIEARVVEKQLTDTIEKRLTLEKGITGSNFEQVVIGGKLVRVQKVFYGTAQDIRNNQDQINTLKQSEIALTKKLASLQPPQITPKDFDPKKEDKSSETEAKRLAKSIQEIMEIPEGIVFKDFDTDKEALLKAQATIKGFFDGSIFRLKLRPEVSFSEPEIRSDISELTSEVLKQYEKNIQGSNVSFRSGSILGQEFVDGVNSTTAAPTTFDQSLFDVEALTSKFTPLFAALGQKLPKIDLSQSFEVNDKNLQAILDNLSATISSGLESVLNNAFQNIGSGIGEALGNALSGKTESIGDSIMNAIGGLISELGKALIKYGAIKTGLDKILGPGGIAIPGGVAIALGIAAVAAGQAFKNFGGFRATGGPVQAGKGYIVGENGPEFFTPSVSGSIIPNDKFSSASRLSSTGAGSMHVVVSGSLRGDRLRLQQKRAERRERRTT